MSEILNIRLTLLFIFLFFCVLAGARNSSAETHQEKLVSLFIWDSPSKFSDQRDAGICYFPFINKIKHLEEIRTSSEGKRKREQ